MLIAEYTFKLGGGKSYAQNQHKHGRGHFAERFDHSAELTRKTSAFYKVYIRKKQRKSDNEPYQRRIYYDLL